MKNKLLSSLLLLIPITLYASGFFGSGGGGGGGVSSVTGSTPISSSGGATPDISIANGAADGSTKGAVSFTASDFDASSGNVSIDYTNGQAASGSTKGFLTSGDWTTFNSKQSTVSFTTFGSTPNANGGGISAGVITLQPADGTNPGGVTTGTQTIAGAKTFSTSVSTPHLFQPSLTTSTPSGTTQTIDFSNGNIQKLALGSASGNVTVSFSNPQITSYTILITQGATARTITWPTVKWVAGSAPTLSGSSVVTDVIGLTYDGSNYYGTYSLNHQ